MPSPSVSPEPLAAAALAGDPARRLRERFVRSLFVAAGVVSVLVTVFILYTVTFEALRFLAAIDPRSLVSDGWFPRRGQFDILTLLLGTLIVAAIAMLVAAPVGLGAAIYLSEYASARMRRLLKPVVEVLAGIPSVVVGFFALTFLNPRLVQAVFEGAQGFNLLVAGLGVGVLTVPLVASVSEDAMRAVPASLREASYGLGARRATTTVAVVLPAAVSGIVAAFVVALSRAIGETMVVAIAAGGTGGSLRTVDPLGPGQTITAAMAALATGSDQVRGDDGAFESLFFLGLLLFLVTFGLNLVGDRFVRRVRQAY